MSFWFNKSCFRIYNNVENRIVFWRTSNLSLYAVTNLVEDEKPQKSKDTNTESQARKKADTYKSNFLTWNDVSVWFMKSLLYSFMNLDVSKFGHPLGNPEVIWLTSVIFPYLSSKAKLCGSVAKSEVSFPTEFAQLRCTKWN